MMTFKEFLITLAVIGTINMAIWAVGIYVVVLIVKVVCS